MSSSVFGFPIEPSEEVRQAEFKVELAQQEIARAAADLRQAGLGLIVGKDGQASVVQPQPATLRVHRDPQKGYIPVCESEADRRQRHAQEQATLKFNQMQDNLNAAMRDAREAGSTRPWMTQF